MAGFISESDCPLCIMVDDPRAMGPGDIDVAVVGSFVLGLKAGKLYTEGLTTIAMCERHTLLFEDMVKGAPSPKVHLERQDKKEAPS